ncbi:MAG: hypothetical protein AB8I08_34480 [Sandaracinaceae bacterium]
MAFEQEKRDALHLLTGIENGTMSTSDAAYRIEQADPALVYFVLTWIRSRYAGDHPAAEGVLGRIVQLTSKHGSVARQMREGKSDALVAWFEEQYGYRDFDAQGFIDLIVEKLEG